MSSAAAAMPSSLAVEAGFAEMERQRELITSCTALWKELKDHFSSIEKGLELRSESLCSKRRTLELSIQGKLDFLNRREESIDGAVDYAIARVEELHAAALVAVSSRDEPSLDLPSRLHSLCAKMDSNGFFELVASSRKETDLLRKELPHALKRCIDPPRFVMDAIAIVFPLDRRTTKSRPGDLGWVSLLLLEGLVCALEDPKMGMERLLVTRIVKERAREMADAWKELMEQRGGLENAKAQDVHAFLQHLVTFGIGMKEEKKLYRKMVVSFSWRKQMPKLAISLGLEDEMTEIIDELISKGQPLDAIHFAYESGLNEKYPSVPLLKAYLRDAKKTAALIPEDGINSGQSANNSFRKELSAIRAVMKCIEEHKLEPEFPLENLNKRLENLEKAKVEKRKTSVGPANKRTRANNCVMMPPAKAGRLTNNACVSSFPAASAPTYAKTPPSHATYQTSPFAPYPYERPAGHGFYTAHPMNYPAYGAYSNGMGAYNNGMPPGYQQQAYYR